MLKEFKEFALKGNVVDLAVGVIIGGAFGKIVSSLVENIIMPPIGLVLGGVDFSNMAITLRAATPDAGAVTLKYGMFINSIIDFLIIAFSIFMVIHSLNKLKKKEEAKPATTPVPSKEETLLTEIRDLLKK